MEWYYVCWPWLTAKRVEPVVSISWASCWCWSRILTRLYRHCLLCAKVMHYSMMRLSICMQMAVLCCSPVHFKTVVRYSVMNYEYIHLYSRITVENNNKLKGKNKKKRHNEVFFQIKFLHNVRLGKFGCDTLVSSNANVFLLLKCLQKCTDNVPCHSETYWLTIESPGNRKIPPRQSIPKNSYNWPYLPLLKNSVKKFQDPDRDPCQYQNLISRCLSNIQLHRRGKGLKSYMPGPRRRRRRGSRRRMRRGEGCPLSIRLGGLRERCKLSQAENGFWCILKPSWLKNWYAKRYGWRSSFKTATPVANWRTGSARCPAPLRFFIKIRPQLSQLLSCCGLRNRQTHKEVCALLNAILRIECFRKTSRDILWFYQQHCAAPPIETQLFYSDVRRSKLVAWQRLSWVTGARWDRQCCTTVGCCRCQSLFYTISLSSVSFYVSFAESNPEVGKLLGLYITSDVNKDLNNLQGQHHDLQDQGQGHNPQSQGQNPECQKMPQQSSD